MYAMKMEGYPHRDSRDYNANKETWDESYNLALKETEAHFTKKGHQLAQIANPENDKEWFATVMSYRGWGDNKNRFTLHKLEELARSHIPVNE